MKEYLVHSDFYRKLFPSDPDFGRIKFFSLTISNDDVYATFDLPNIFPRNAPPQWKKNKADSIRLVFSFLQFSNLHINNISTENFCSLKIIEHGQAAYAVCFNGDAGELSLDCKFISIGGVLPYTNQ